MAASFQTIWHEDSSATVLGRLTARNGSGAYTGRQGEGRWLKEVDITSITCNVFDRSSATPDTPFATPTINVATAIFDSPETNNQLWTKDKIGWNFLVDLAPSNFPTEDHQIEVEFKVTLTDATVFFGSYIGVVEG